MFFMFDLPVSIPFTIKSLRLITRGARLAVESARRCTIVTSFETRKHGDLFWRKPHFELIIAGGEIDR